MCGKCYYINLNIHPMEIYLFGVAATMFINSLYKCNKELEKQNDGENKYNMTKVANKTIAGLTQGISSGLFWPMIVPTMIYRSISNNCLSIYNRMFGNTTKQIDNK